MLAHVELVRLVKSRKIKAVFFDGLTAWTVNHQKEEVKKLMETIERKGEE